MALNFARRLIPGGKRKQQSYDGSLIALENNAVKGDLFGYGTIPYGYYGGGVAGRSGELTFDKYGAAMAYMTVPVANRAVNLIADAFDAIPYRIVRNATNDPANDETIASSTDIRPEHPLTKALHIAHNESKQSLFWLSAFAMLMYGDNFIEPLWGRESQKFVGLKWLNPVAVTTVVGGGRVLYYQYTYPAGGGSVTFKPEEIVHDHTRNPYDDFGGLSKVVVAMNKVNLLRDMDRFLGDYFKNNATPGGVVSPENEGNFSNTDVQRLRDYMRDNLQGSGNQYRWVISPAPSKWTPLQQPDLDKTYVVNDPVTRAFYTTFGIPLSMAGDDAGTQYKAGDPIRVAFYQNAIIPFAKDLEKFFNYEIMPLFDPLGVERLVFDLSEFDTVSEDDEIRSRVANANYAGGIWTLNESRVYTGEDPDTTALGDRYFTPPTPLGILASPPSATQAPPDSATPSIEEVAPELTSKSVSDEPSELKAWRRHALNRGAVKSAGVFDCKAVDSGIEAYIRHELIDLGGQASKSQINGLFDAVDVMRGVKGYGETRAAFKEQILRIIQDGRKDEISRRRFQSDLRTLTRRSGLDTVFNAFEDADNPIESLPSDMLTIFRAWQAETNDYIRNFGEELFKQGGISDAEVPLRVDMWANKTLNDIYHAALREANDALMATWNLGGTIDHCHTCRSRNGTKHSLKEWGKLGFPQDRRLDCGGWLCDCYLTNAKGERLGAR